MGLKNLRLFQQVWLSCQNEEEKNCGQVFAAAIIDKRQDRDIIIKDKN